jgi:hypothetical protein
MYLAEEDARERGLTDDDLLAAFARSSLRGSHSSSTSTIMSGIGSWESFEFRVPAEMKSDLRGILRSVFAVAEVIS